MLSEPSLDLVITVITLISIAGGIFLVSSVLASCVYSVHRKYANKNEQGLKSAWIMLHVLCAFCTSVIVTLWLSLPGSPSLPTVIKHCHSSHCGWHVPATINSSFLGFLFIFFVLGMLLICWGLFKTQQKKLKAKISVLLRLSPNTRNAENPWPDVNIIESAQPVILNVGLIYPKLLLSTHLTNSLNAHDIKLLLAYEYGKAKQFENIKVKLVQIMCLLWPSHYRSLLVLDLRATLRKRAYSDIRQLLGSQKHTIPDEIINNVASDIRQFVLQIKSDPHCLAELADTDFLSVTDYLFCGLYFIFLVIVTSNLLHILFELIG